MEKARTESWAVISNVRPRPMSIHCVNYSRNVRNVLFEVSTSYHVNVNSIIQYMYVYVGKWSVSQIFQSPQDRSTVGGKGKSKKSDFHTKTRLSLEDVVE